MKIYYLFIPLIICFSCKSKGQEAVLPATINESEIVKIIETRTYTAKPSFENFVPDEPVGALGYDWTLDVPMSWENNYYDKYNNVIKTEQIKFLKNGNEEVFSTKYYTYCEPEIGKLKQIEVGNYTDDYKYDSVGRLIEITTIKGGSELTKKIKYTYDNLSNDIMKIELYKENGLIEKTEYTYFKEKNAYLETIEYVENNEISRTYYEKDSQGRQIYKKREYQNKYSDNLISSTEYRYSDFYDTIPLKISITGFETIIETNRSTGKVNYRKTDDGETIHERKFNENHDIIEYKHYTPRTKTTKKTLLEKLSYEPHYKLYYTYNENNEWIEILLDVGTSKYICQRKITYLK